MNLNPILNLLVATFGSVLLAAIFAGIEVLGWLGFVFVLANPSGQIRPPSRQKAILGSLGLALISLLFIPLPASRSTYPPTLTSSGQSPTRSPMPTIRQPSPIPSSIATQTPTFTPTNTPTPTPTSSSTWTPANIVAPEPTSSSCTAPSYALIDSPSDGQTVIGPTVVIAGTASHPQFEHYELKYRPAAAPNVNESWRDIYITNPYQTRNLARLATWNVGDKDLRGNYRIPSGDYMIRLRTVHNGDYDACSVLIHLVQPTPPVQR